MEILRSAQFDREGFIAAFTTRKGGWSPPPFDGANMGYGVPDDPVNVARNRECALELLGLARERNRQLAHAAYHAGQVVLLAKHFEAGRWESLSIPRAPRGRHCWPVPGRRRGRRGPSRASAA